MSPLVWNVDPVLLRIGPVEVRYYGICFGLAIATGYLIWAARARRFGESRDFTESFLLYTFPGVVIGGRLGYCLFYAPKVYLADPLQMFAIWDGGIASHGVSIGIACSLWAFGRRHHITWLRISDYFAPAVALAVGWIRVGNFFNSEVVGRPTTVPWAVVFERYDMVPRHPAQLYDLLIGPATYLLIRHVEKRNIRPIGSGLLVGTFFAFYFGVRIFVEHYKAFYFEQLREIPPFSTVESWLGFPIHTGQWLSLLPFMIGIVLIVRAMRSPVIHSHPVP